MPRCRQKQALHIDQLKHSGTPAAGNDGETREENPIQSHTTQKSAQPSKSGEASA